MREIEFASTPIKRDAPAQTQSPGTGKDTAEIFPEQFLMLLFHSLLNGVWLFKIFCFNWLLPPCALQAMVSQPSALPALTLSFLFVLLTFGAHDPAFHRNNALPCTKVQCFPYSISNCH